MKKPRCSVTEASCTCVRKSGHRGYHRCSPPCNGQWKFDENGNFRVKALPGMDDPILSFLGFL